MEYYENDEEFFNMFFEGKVLEAVRAVNYGDYNYTDEFVHFNAYGNLDSTDDLSRVLRDYANEIIDTTLELVEKEYIDINDMLERYK